MRAVLCGYYGKGNCGDEALLATLLQMLPPQVTPVVLTGNPRETADRYGVEVCDRASSFTILQTLRSADAFIFGGGSLIQDTTSRLSPLYYCGLMGLAQRLGLQTLAWAQGIGPLNHRTTKFLARSAFQGCQSLSVRDSGSAKLLSNWDLPCLLAPDPVWALDATPIPLPQLTAFTGPRIALSLRPSPDLTPERLARLIKALGDLQQKTGAFIVLLPLHPSQDLAIAQKVQESLPGPSEIITLEDPRELKGVFQQIDLMISMRLHGLIMAASEGARCFALSYDPKVSRLMTETEIPGWEIGDLPLDTGVITQRWVECLERGALPAEKIGSLRDRALMHRDLLHSILAV
jgi:polysaccharide pyruvyl transferase CsaB